MPARPAAVNAHGSSRSVAGPDMTFSGEPKATTATCDGEIGTWCKHFTIQSFAMQQRPTFRPGVLRIEENLRKCRSACVCRPAVSGGGRGPGLCEPAPAEKAVRIYTRPGGHVGPLRICCRVHKIADRHRTPQRQVESQWIRHLHPTPHAAVEQARFQSSHHGESRIGNSNLVCSRERQLAGKHPGCLISRSVVQRDVGFTSDDVSRGN